MTGRAGREDGGDAERRRLSGIVRRFRAGLEGEAEAGMDPLPLEGPSPFERLAPPAAAPAPRARPAAAPARGPGRASRERTLSALAAEIAACTLCGLSRGRTQTVPGEGDPEATVMFVGEGPGEQEDLSGRPFVGRAGQLLRRLIREQLGRDPSEVFIANIVKCRPPENRAPLADEAEACLPFLRRQVAAVRPRIIVTLGNPSTRSLLRTTEGITRLRGRPVRRGDFVFFPTYHPSYLLRNQAALPQGEADFRAVRALAAEVEGGG